MLNPEHMGFLSAESRKQPNAVFAYVQKLATDDFKVCRTAVTSQPAKWPKSGPDRYAAAAAAVAPADRLVLGSSTTGYSPPGTPPRSSTNSSNYRSGQNSPVWASSNPFFYSGQTFPAMGQEKLLRRGVGFVALKCC